MTSMGAYLKQYWLGFSVIAVLILLPLFSSEYIQVVAMTIFVWGVFAISYDLLIGFSGIVSFGHAMFFGTGAYISALLMLKAGFSLGHPALRGGQLRPDRSLGRAIDVKICKYLLYHCDFSPGAIFLFRDNECLNIPVYWWG